MLLAQQLTILVFFFFQFFLFLDKIRNCCSKNLDKINSYSEALFYKELKIFFTSFRMRLTSFKFFEILYKPDLEESDLIFYETKQNK